MQGSVHVTQFSSRASLLIPVDAPWKVVGLYVKRSWQNKVKSSYCIYTAIIYKLSRMIYCTFSYMLQVSQ